MLHVYMYADYLYFPLKFSPRGQPFVIVELELSLSECINLYKAHIFYPLQSL